MIFRGTLTLLVFAVSFSLGQAQRAFAQYINCDFSNNLMYVNAPTAGGTLSFFAHTGGGSFLLGERARRAGIKPMADESGNLFVDMDVLLGQAGLPMSGHTEALMLPAAEGDLECGADGTLGQNWFSQHVWSIDFPGQQLSCYQPALSAEGEYTLPLTFKQDENGQRLAHLPVVKIEIDGMALPFILDTGAKLLPTAEAAEMMGYNPMMNMPVATSFIAESILEQWEAAHPEWRLIEHADQELGNVKLLEVPAISVAGQEVGPVWFCSRSDEHYLVYASRYTDRPVVGALGGSALQHFKLTLDYPNALAKFEKYTTTGRHLAAR
jgi:hypothetical protein